MYETISEYLLSYLQQVFGHLNSSCCMSYNLNKPILFLCRPGAESFRMTERCSLGQNFEMAKKLLTDTNKANTNTE